MPSIGRRSSVALSCRHLLALVCGAVLMCAAPAWAAAPDPPTGATAQPDHTEQWDWPVEGPTGGAPAVLRRFDPPDQPWLGGHRGVDLESSPYALVRAAGAGSVVFAGRLAGRGVVSVDHPNGLRTTYEPVDPWVVAGEPVGEGTVLGLLEPLTTHCGRSCLHWGVRRGAAYLDPLVLLDPSPPVLLPYGAPVQQALLTSPSWWLS
ncbi:MAG TPA: M23 family metallopeptidase [Candidatus Limnocylindria bacterium]|nr:M23 family metallopeptidase [Candidatus Limnocylindria bacterium]